ncbi:MAG: hypothetical protein ACLR5B_01480 [Blautia sp.]
MRRGKSGHFPKRRRDNVKSLMPSWKKETDAKIRDIRNELEKEKDSRLAALKEDTEQHLVHLDSFYKENHQRISEELFKKNYYSLIQMNEDFKRKEVN